MRLFSWTGWAALATAAVAGYLTSEAVHGDRGREHARSMIGFAEESEFVDRAIPGKLPTLPAEEIDLTCMPQRAPEEINRQTSEPPLADGPEVVRAARTIPEGVEYWPDPGSTPVLVSGGFFEPPPPLRIPYLIDDDFPPAVLPMPDGDDAANAYPVRQCIEPPAGPIWDAVSKYFGDAAKCLPSAHIEKPPAEPDETRNSLRDARARPISSDEPDFTNPNLGKPPTGVLPEVREIPDPTPLPGKSGKRQPPTVDG